MAKVSQSSQKVYFSLKNVSNFKKEPGQALLLRTFLPARTLWQKVCGLAAL